MNQDMRALQDELERIRRCLQTGTLSQEEANIRMNDIQNEANDHMARLLRESASLLRTSVAAKMRFFWSGFFLGAILTPIMIFIFRELLK